MGAFTLEVAVFSLQGAVTAQNAGADRIEFCENPGEGGTTPSYGTLLQVKKKISIPVFPIIRPHGGDFFYSADEFEAMQQDVMLCKRLGFEGLVLGILNEDGSIDIPRTSQLVDLAYPLEVTFHRAFDRCLNPLKSLQDVIATGCQRILTSGQRPLALEGAELIASLVNAANGEIEIMPGSGVRANNIEALAKLTGANEFHTSARLPIASKMKFEVNEMNETLAYAGVDEQEVKAIIKKLQGVFQS